MNPIVSDLLDITSPFIQDETDDNYLSSTSLRYRDYLLKQVALDRESTINQEEIYNSNGKAVSINTAVDCLDDHNRTRQFILGTYKAIQSLLKQGKKNIRILYAGTGPFAAILLPSMIRLQQDNLHYTLMDINPATLEKLTCLLKKMDLDTAAVNIVEADASQYVFTNKEHYDIIISETMQAALAREQQLSVFLNLMRQSTEEVIFIPEKIEVFLGVRTVGLDHYQLTQENCTVLEKVFEVSKEALASHIKGDTRELSFSKTNNEIRKADLRDKDLLLLITKIKVFKDQVLDIHESGLTRPLIIENISHKHDQNIAVEVSYTIDEEPRFELQIRELSI